MEDQFEKATQQAAAFQKMWAESAAKIMQTAFTMGSDSAPPEILRQIRSGIFKALANSWEQFMRSPQFLEGMKQWIEQAINLRKVTNDFLAKARNELQAPSSDDVKTIMLSIRHVEKRLLDRIDDLAAQLRKKNVARGRKTNQRVPGVAAGRRPLRKRATSH
jgi:hypothetical protein